MTDVPAVRRLDPDRRSEAIAAVSRAFWPDPLFGFFARDEVQEHRVLPLFLGALLRDCLAHGEVWSTVDHGRITGAASWLPPSALPRSRLREARIYAACARALVTCRNRRTGIRLLDAVERAHPAEPHWYLALLGVDPSRQRRGLGGRLLEPVLERCDREVENAYLETQKPENLPFYERFGFVVIGEVRVDDSPTIWRMWREPDPSRSR